MNHISLEKKGRPRCFAKSSTVQDMFQASSAALRLLGNGDCYLMHEMQSGSWLYPYDRHVSTKKKHVLYYSRRSLQTQVMCIARLLAEVSTVGVGFCKTGTTVPHSIWYFRSKISYAIFTYEYHLDSLLLVYQQQQDLSIIYIRPSIWHTVRLDKQESGATLHNQAFGG